jgi:hypothetical protein
MFKGWKVLLVASHSILLMHIAIALTCNALSILNCDMQQTPLFVTAIYVKFEHFELRLPYS